MCVCDGEQERVCMRARERERERERERDQKLMRGVLVIEGQPQMSVCLLGGVRDAVSAAGECELD